MVRDCGLVGGLRTACFQDRCGLLRPNRNSSKAAEAGRHRAMYGGL